MTLLDAPRPTSGTTPLDRTGSALLALGGLGFFAYGPLHPQGGDEGDKTEQLHSMLVDPLWYPAHAVGLLAFAALTLGLLMIARGPGLSPRVARTTRAVGWVSVLMTLGQVIHLCAATQSHAIESGGGMTPLLGLFVGIETVVNPVWALAIAALAVVGGTSRTVGNRLLLVLGLVGGLAFALANATIAFTDLFDPLFPVAGLIGLWAIAVGAVGLARTRSHQTG